MSRKTEMAGVFNIQVEWLNNKINCNAEIISNTSYYSKVVTNGQSMPVGCVITSAERCRVLAVCPSLC